MNVLLIFCKKKPIDIRAKYTVKLTESEVRMKKKTRNMQIMAIKYDILSIEHIEVSFASDIFGKKIVE